MKIYLPTNNFAFFKILSGSLFLVAAITFPTLAAYSFIIALMVGRAHSLGAWIAMWRAGKFNWKYITWISLLSIVIAFWGLKIVSSLELLAFITYLFFTFHFLFDEFDLQEEERSVQNIIPSISPSILLVLSLCKDYFHLNIHLSVFLIIAAALLAIEFLYVRNINWFFVHMKILTLFILSALFLHVTGSAMLAVFLIFHYAFWFIYPIYKLHKYRREERDSFIMILLLMVSSSVYFSLTRNSYGDEVFNLVVKSFYIGTIIHILATAPFGYLFGLPRKKYQQPTPPTVLPATPSV